LNHQNTNLVFQEPLLALANLRHGELIAQAAQNRLIRQAKQTDKKATIFKPGSRTHNEYERFALRALWQRVWLVVYR
jgi:hypothetical protein